LFVSYGDTPAALLKYVSADSAAFCSVTAAGTAGGATKGTASSAAATWHSAASWMATGSLQVFQPTCWTCALVALCWNAAKSPWFIVHLDQRNIITGGVPHKRTEITPTDFLETSALLHLVLRNRTWRRCYIGSFGEQGSHIHSWLCKDVLQGALGFHTAAGQQQQHPAAEHPLKQHQAAASHHNHPKILQATQRGVLLSECLQKLLQLSERCKARLLTLCKDTLSFLLVLPSAHVILLRLQGNHVCRSNTIALQAGFFPQEQRHLKKAAAHPRMPK